MLKNIMLAGVLAFIGSNSYADVVDNQSAQDIFAQADQFWASHQASQISGPPGTTILKMEVWIDKSDGKGGQWVVTDTIFPNNPMKIDATFVINPDAQGVPGLFFISKTNGITAEVLTPDNGWTPFQLGLLSPYAVADSGLPSSYTIKLLDNQKPCDVFGTSDLMAGYGLLNAEASQAATNIINAGSRMPPEHILRTFITSDMQKNNRYWKAFRTDCSSFRGD
ncbi:hypothetical protein QU487_06255 [Crenobacter sp. SG2305]|uniref:hypothetical protein n=1 Tax=Crenobacter oryzisoli TaxID=3056844 RepID=UPI0025AA991E|nr:hypothetical protein [Crenobacter sp. SG2305]MDN0082354.1 hypothetical protein [Crenobacter sp. SG2305]